ncbi:MAG: 30S ribosome-binding factor RbfA [Planctomycetaceae bacterium]|jgi:ribosome-binding factor A|nr:30S ribosome-binding factor RbfA [Planctomycetaceae bacterium]
MSRRTLKAAEAIRQIVSMAILTEIQDPRVSDVTVVRVEVSGDMQTAKIYVSVMGDETKQNLCIKGLKSSAGFLQSKVAKRIETRYTPHLDFVLDQGIKKQLLVSKILDEILPKNDLEDHENQNKEEE